MYVVCLFHKLPRICFLEVFFSSSTPSFEDTRRLLTYYFTVSKIFIYDQLNSSSSHLFSSLFASLRETRPHAGKNGSSTNWMRMRQLLPEKPGKGSWMTFKTARLVSFKILVSVIMCSPGICRLRQILNAIAFKLSQLGVFAGVFIYCFKILK